MNITRPCGHTYITTLLNKSSVVLDCGANHGEFSKWLATEIGCQVYAFEPDSRLFVELPVLEKVSYVQSAVMPTAGSVTLYLGTTQDSSTVFSETAKSATVPAVTLEEFCRTHKVQGIDLIKMDIEGAELGVLNALSEAFLSNISQITVEFHDFVDRAQTIAIQQCLRGLERKGFWVLKASHRDHSDVLLVNRRLVDLSLWQRFAMKLNGRWLRGLRHRILRRSE